MSLQRVFAVILALRLSHFNYLFVYFVCVVDVTSVHFIVYPAFRIHQDVITYVVEHPLVSYYYVVERALPQPLAKYRQAFVLHSLVVHTCRYGLELAHYFRYIRTALIYHYGMYMVRHYNGIWNFEALKSCRKRVNAFFYHASGLVQAQLVVFNVAEQLTPVFGYYRYEITSIAGVVITF